MSVSKMIMGQAANRYADPVNVENVFNTTLYTGNGGSTATINNGIDLTGKGGLVWIKARNAAENHVLFDTDRGVTKYLSSNLRNAEATSTGTLTDFFNNGFKVDGGGTVGSSTDPYVSWSFRKQPKFFDIVTYTGNGSVRNISHNLGSVPGMIIVKCTSAGSSYWTVYHRALDASSPEDKYVYLDSTNAVGDFTGYWNDTAPTSSVFTLGTGNGDDTNANGATYVAYLFAHNDGDGGFGLTNDQDIIKCGSFNTPSSGNLDVSLGFEPQFILFKRTDSSENWGMRDVMRGMSYASNGDARLWPNLASQEYHGDAFNPTPTGFTVQGGADLSYSATYIYMAIRRGDMAVPTAASSVFAVATGNNATAAPFEGYTAGFPVDMFIAKVDKTSSSYSNELVDRVRGSTTSAKAVLETENTSAEDNSFDGGFHLNLNSNTGINHASAQNLPNGIAWMWKRAPGYFDVCCYTGNGGGNRDITHNLGSAPGMLWLKRRDGSSPYGDWYVQHTGIAASQYLRINDTAAITTSPDAWNSTYASADVFRVGSDNNVSNFEYIVYLFGTVAGVSKVGSYTGNGSSTGDTQTIDCGFSSGARFVLIKRTSGNGAWYIFDTARGIVSAADKYLTLNSNAAEVSGGDYIDPDSSGFTVVQHPATETNTSGQTYIFYAIA